MKLIVIFNFISLFSKTALRRHVADQILKDLIIFFLILVYFLSLSMVTILVLVFIYYHYYLVFFSLENYYFQVCCNLSESHFVYTALVSQTMSNAIHRLNLVTVHWLGVFACFGNTYSLNRNVSEKKDSVINPVEDSRAKRNGYFIVTKFMCFVLLQCRFSIPKSIQ